VCVSVCQLRSSAISSESRRWRHTPKEERHCVIIGLRHHHAVLPFQAQGRRRLEPTHMDACIAFLVWVHARIFSSHELTQGLLISPTTQSHKKIRRRRRRSTIITPPDGGGGGSLPAEGTGQQQQHAAPAAAPAPIDGIAATANGGRRSTDISIARSHGLGGTAIGGHADAAAAAAEAAAAAGVPGAAAGLATGLQHGEWWW
jgi:hypothetical protein